MKCSNCGEKIQKKYNICPFCGEKIQQRDTVKNFGIYYKVVIAVLFLSLLITAVMLVQPTFLKPNIEQLKDSVVQIYVYDEYNNVIATGSGVVVFESDIIITNAHVVEDNYKLEVLSENNTKYKVQGIIGYNKKKDIAILKIYDKNKLKPLETENSISVGEEVIAIGSPIGLKNTVSNGVFSGYFQDEIEVYQHTAPISPGSSGGALFNNKGDLVGITYATLNEGQNINFAIPINEVKKEYNIVKNNICVDTKYYKFLNNGILKTNLGNELLSYVLNDKYSNETNTKDPSEIGWLKYSSLSKKEGFNKIEKYVKSSVYVHSGETSGVYLNGQGNIKYMKKYECSYYSIFLIKLNLFSEEAIKAITEYFEEYAMDYSEEGKKFINYEVQYGNEYIYLIEYTDFDSIDEVKTILNKFISESTNFKKDNDKDANYIKVFLSIKNFIANLFE